MKKWTTQDIPDLKGKVIIVTGGNSGLGLQSVKVLAAKGAQVVMACRSLAKGEKARLQLSFPAKVVVMRLDLSDFESVRTFVSSFLEKYQRLDVLMNNAGVMLRPFEISSCGVESHLATNHLGHFLLTRLLQNVLAQTPQSRVVSISSLAHRKGVFDFDNINYDAGKSYEPMAAYRRSKLACLLFAQELQRVFEDKGISTQSLAAHPGVVPTNLVNHRFSRMRQALIRPLAQLILQKPAQGALPQLRAATDPKARGGDYFGPSASNEWRGAPVLVKPNPAACKLTWAKQLWIFSEKITSCKF